MERLRHEAKQRLKALREAGPHGESPQLADAQFTLAREYGFPSWRALKSYVDAAAEAPVITLGGEDLCSAANRKDIVRVRHLLNRREKPKQAELDLALVRAICGQGRTDDEALRFAIGDLLLEAGANPNGQYGGGYGPIVFAACEGVDVEALEYLLEHGADVSFAPVATKYGLQSPVSHAAFTYVRGRNARRHRVLEILLNHGAVYRDDAFFAILRGDTARLARFLEADPALITRRFPELAGIGNPDLAGATLLHFAIEFGEEACADLLLERGADLSAPADSPAAQTPLFHAIRSWRGAHYKLLRHLLETQGGRIDWEYRAVLSPGEGEPLRPVTPMEYAGCQKREVRLLQRFGAPALLSHAIPALPGEVSDAFNRACWNGEIDTAHRLLHEHPGLIGGFPLETVARRCVWHRPQMREIALLMIGHGAAAELPVLARCGLLDEVIRELDDEPSLLDLPDDKGRTALYRATCVYGSFPEGEAVARELLQRGARLDIWSACTLGEVEAVRRILAEDRDAAAMLDPDGMAPLHWACRPRQSSENTPEIVRLLCEHGADLEAANPTEEGMHPLHHCGEWATRPDVVEVLLEFGAALNAPAANGWTPLDYAIDRGRHAMVAFLTEKGATRSPKHDDLGRQFLKLVSQAEDEEALRPMLEEHPALINTAAPHPLWGGRPQPLHIAIERGHERLFQWLLEQGADINGVAAQYDGWNPLLLALYHRRSAMAAILQELGAEVGLPTALMLGDDERAFAMLEAEPGLVHATMPSLASPLRFAVTAAAVRRLLALGAPLEQRDRYGRPPLEAIIERGTEGRHAVLRALIEAEAETPPWVLAALGDLPRFKAAAAFQPELVHDTRCAFAAVAAGQTALVVWMLEEGLSVDSRDAREATLLHAAAWEGNLPLVRDLVRRGADTTALDAEYRATPRQWAATALERLGRSDCREVAEWLDAYNG